MTMLTSSQDQRLMPRWMGPLAEVGALQWALFALFGLLLPGACAYLMVANPFLGLNVLRWGAVLLLLWAAFVFSADHAPWPVRLLMCVTLGQVVLNYGFTNIVIGAGSAKVTLAEGSCLISLLVLVPQTYRWLSQHRLFWLAIAAMVYPLVVHLYSDFFTYKMAAMRDVISVVDIGFFLAGMAMVALGVARGQWLAWRTRFLRAWFVAGGLYGLTSPFSATIKAVSPAFSSYQQSVPVLGEHITSPYTVIGILVAWFAIPHVFPKRSWLRTVWISVAALETVLVVVLAQSRNLYILLMYVTVALAFFGYRRAFGAVMVGLLALVLALGLIETLNIKIPGRISDVSLSAVTDRFLSISGKHGDRDGAHGTQQRLAWWASSLDKWRAGPDTMVFGVGYGPALTNFMSPGGDHGEGVVVREPHNSFVSSLVRGGIVYFVLWGSLLVGCLRRAWQGARMPGLDPQASGQFKGFAAWSFIMMGMLLITSMSEPQFETPSVAVMFYMVAGMVAMEYEIVSGRINVARGGERAPGV